jgi:NAD(P)-dependent dehydrogenase (short-subunit alcohol dehydrogenase family)
VLHGELAPLGIHVTVVEPGSFRTNFLSPDSVRRAAQSIPAYADTVGQFVAALETNSGHQPGDPGKFVAAIRQLAVTTDPPLRLPLGSDCVITSVVRELSQWRGLALSIDYKSG